MNIEMYDLRKTEDCVQLMVDTDDLYATSKARSKACEYLLKAHLAEALLGCEGGTVEEKKAKSLISVKELGKIQEYQDSIRDYELLSAKRETANLQIEIWRSKLSARKAGIV